MKTLISIILALFLSPVAADSSILYEHSGGYESSGGYEHSGGYGTFDDHELPDSYKHSDGYEHSEGYESFEGTGTQDVTSNRLSNEKYNTQVEKEEERKNRWVRRHVEDVPIRHRLRSWTNETGGMDDLGD